MLSPWSCQGPPSVVRVRTYSRRDLVRGFSCYRPGLVRAHRQLSESARLVTVILSEASHAIALILSEPTVSCQSPHVYSPWSLSGLTVDYQNLDMCFTDCHSNRDFRTIYAWNEISQFSINCIPIINHQSNIYYIHEQLHVLIVDYRLRIPPCGSRCFPISTIDCVYPVHMYSQDLFLYLWWDTFPLFE
jgi:hypothetical protein